MDPPNDLVDPLNDLVDPLNNLADHEMIWWIHETPFRGIRVKFGDYSDPPNYLYFRVSLIIL